MKSATKVGIFKRKSVSLPHYFIKTDTLMKYLLAFSFLSFLLTGCKHVFHFGDILDGPGMVYTPPTDSTDMHSSDDSIGTPTPTDSTKAVEQKKL